MGGYHPADSGIPMFAGVRRTAYNVLSSTTAYPIYVNSCPYANFQSDRRNHMRRVATPTVKIVCVDSVDTSLHKSPPVC